MTLEWRAAKMASRARRVNGGGAKEYSDAAGCKLWNGKAIGPSAICIALMLAESSAPIRRARRPEKLP
jgi:hypothetical protein